MAFEGAMIEHVLAGIGLGVCLLLMLRMAVGERRRRLADAAMRRHWSRLGQFWTARRRRVRKLRQQRHEARVEADAAREADELIRRVKRDVDRDADRDGNVIRPHAFRQRRGDRTQDQPRKPH